MSIRFARSRSEFKSWISLLIFCLVDDLSNTDNGVLKSPTIIVWEFKSLCKSLRICLMYLGAPVLGAYIFRIVSSSCCTHGSVFCFLSPLHPHFAFLPRLSLPTSPSHWPSPFPPNRPQCLVLPSLCPHVLLVQQPPMNDNIVFGFLFLCQFAENGFQIHPCPYEGHELIIFYGCIVFHGVYVPRFPYPVCHQWVLALEKIEIKRQIYCSSSYDH